MPKDTPTNLDIEHDELVEVATKLSVAFRILQSASEDLKLKDGGTFRKGKVLDLARRADAVILDLAGLADETRRATR